MKYHILVTTDLSSFFNNFFKELWISKNDYFAMLYVIIDYFFTKEVVVVPSLYSEGSHQGRMCKVSIALVGSLSRKTGRKINC